LDGWLQPRLRFCQNWDISKARAMTPTDLARRVDRRSGGARRLQKHRLHLNDPVIFAEYAIDTGRAAHARG